MLPRWACDLPRAPISTEAVRATTVRGATVAGGENAEAHAMQRATRSRRAIGFARYDAEVASSPQFRAISTPNGDLRLLLAAAPR